MVLTQAFHGRSCDLPGQHWYCDQLVPTAKAGSYPELMPWGWGVVARDRSQETHKPAHRPIGAGESQKL